MYVNELTVDYGKAGRDALTALFQMAHEKGIIAEKFTPEFVTL
jgi:predicted solute-binding protein